MRVMVEVEETIALSNYKTIRTRICLEDEDADIDELGQKARAGVKSQVSKILKTLDKNKLSGGLSSQWARKRRQEQ